MVAGMAGGLVVAGFVVAGLLSVGGSHRRLFKNSSVTVMSL